MDQRIAAATVAEQEGKIGQSVGPFEARWLKTRRGKVVEDRIFNIASRAVRWYDLGVRSEV